MPLRSHTAPLLPCLAAALLVAAGCGDSATSNPSAVPTPSATPSSVFAVPTATPLATPTPTPTPTLRVDHGATPFWPQPGWSDPAARDPVVPATRPADSSGLFGLTPGTQADAIVAGTGTVPATTTVQPASTTEGTPLKTGKASWYGPGFHGRKTASGERYDQNAMTAAMTGVKLGIRVKVVRTDTGASVEVKVNDRGPYEPYDRVNKKWHPHKTRVIDLSKAAMQKLGGIQAGVIPVKVFLLQ